VTRKLNYNDSSALEW